MVGNQSTRPNAKADSNGVQHRTRCPKLGVITNGSLLTGTAGAAAAGNPVPNGTTARANRRVSFFAENSHTQISSQVCSLTQFLYHHPQTICRCSCISEFSQKPPPPLKKDPYLDETYLFIYESFVSDDTCNDLDSAIAFDSG